MAHTLRRSKSKYGRTRRQRKKQRRMRGGFSITESLSGFIDTFKPTTDEKKCEEAREAVQTACSKVEGDGVTDTPVGSDTPVEGFSSAAPIGSAPVEGFSSAEPVGEGFSSAEPVGEGFSSAATSEDDDILQKTVNGGAKKSRRRKNKKRSQSRRKKFKSRKHKK